MNKKYICWVDGSLKGNRIEGLSNPDILKGGWSCIICDEFGRILDILYSGKTGTTNNRMEMMAVLEGLKCFTKPSTITFMSDSEYVVRGVSRYLKENYRIKESAANFDLWTQIYDLINNHNVTIEWVKGHNNNPQNELADFWAQFAARCLNLPKDEYTNNSKESGESLVSESGAWRSDGLNSGQENGKITYSLG